MQVDGKGVGEDEEAATSDKVEVEERVAEPVSVPLFESVLPVFTPISVDVRVAEDVFDVVCVGVSVLEPVEVGVIDEDAPGDRVEVGERVGDEVELDVAVIVRVSADVLEPDIGYGDGDCEAPIDGLLVCDSLVLVVVVDDGVVVPDGVLVGVRLGDLVPEFVTLEVGVDVCVGTGEVNTAEIFSPIAYSVPVGAFVVT
jgi:hypothetical protein